MTLTLIWLIRIRVRVTTIIRVSVRVRVTMIIRVSVRVKFDALHSFLYSQVNEYEEEHYLLLPYQNVLRLQQNILSGIQCILFLFLFLGDPTPKKKWRYYRVLRKGESVKMRINSQREMTTYLSYDLYRHPPHRHLSRLPPPPSHHHHPHPPHHHHVCLWHQAQSIPIRVTATVVVLALAIIHINPQRDRAKDRGR